MVNGTFVFIKLSLENETLDEKYLDAISELEASIANEQNHFRTKMLSGEIILVNNRKVLHGRSNVDEHSPRLFTESDHLPRYTTLWLSHAGI